MLRKTGADTGLIQVLTWPPDAPNDATPAKDDSVNLYAIKVLPGRTSITCMGDVFGTDPTITCKVVPHGSNYTVAVVIKGTFGGFGDGESSYSIGRQDGQNLLKFIDSAGFPPSLSSGGVKTARPDVVFTS
jgi:hypothetical protein